MIVTVHEHDDGYGGPDELRRYMEIDTAEHAPDAVFLSLYMPHPIKDMVETNCYKFDRAEFVSALTQMFGLVDPLELLLQES